MIATNARNGKPVTRRGRRRLRKFSLPALLLGLAVFSAAFLILTHLLLPKDVALAVDGVTTNYATRADTIGEFLAEKNITVAAEDQITPALDAPLQPKQQITLIRAINVDMIADGQTKTICHIPANVVDFLHYANISLGKDDIISLPLDSLLTASTQVKVTRVTKEVKIYREEIACQQERTDDAKLERGISRIVSKGQNGIQKITVELVYHDEQLVERNTLSQEVIKKPVNKVVAYGTISTASRGGQTFDFREVKVVQAYAYSGGGRTATGTQARVGAIAVDPSVIPLGSSVYVEGYGFATAEDTGGAIKGNKVDLYMDTESQCRSWGIRTVKVYIIQ